jgi:hypothetical protein
LTKAKVAITIGLFVAVTLLLGACESFSIAPDVPVAQAPAITDITIEGEVGAEPKVTIPDNLAAEDDTFVQLREGNGSQLSNVDEVSFKIQKVALEDVSKVYSSWNDKDAPEMSVDLTDAFQEQIPPALRELLLKAKVGAVIAFKTTAPRSELDDLGGSGAVSEEEIAKQFANAANGVVDEDVPQVWIITVTKTEKAVVPLDPTPNAS